MPLPARGARRDNPAGRRPRRDRPNHGRNRSNHEESLFRQLVVLAVQYLFEAAYRIRNTDVCTGYSRELFGHEVRLRQESLQSPRPRHRDVAELAHEEAHAEEQDRLHLAELDEGLEQGLDVEELPALHRAVTVRRASPTTDAHPNTCPGRTVSTTMDFS